MTSETKKVETTSNVPAPEAITTPTGLTLSELISTTVEAPKAEAKASKKGTPKAAKAGKASKKGTSKKAAKAAAAKEVASKGPSMRGIARAMILAGHSNEEVTAALLETFGPERFPLPKHAHYAGWYRNELTREGHTEVALKKEPKKVAATPKKVSEVEVLRKELSELKAALEATLKGPKAA